MRGVYIYIYRGVNEYMFMRACVCVCWYTYIRARVCVYKYVYAQPNQNNLHNKSQKKDWPNQY